MIEYLIIKEINAGGFAKAEVMVMWAMENMAEDDFVAMMQRVSLETA